MSANPSFTKRQPPKYPPDQYVWQTTTVDLSDRLTWWNGTINPYVCTTLGAQDNNRWLRTESTQPGDILDW